MLMKETREREVLLQKQRFAKQDPRFAVRNKRNARNAAQNMR